VLFTDTIGPPVLTEAAAGVLLRILLRAAKRSEMAEAVRPGVGAVRSDS
jgi:hypothetical protein